MHHHSRKIFRLHFSLPTAHRHVPESLKRKVRLKYFRPIPARRVPDRLFRRPQVLRIKIPRLVQHFRVPQRNRRSRRSRHAKLHPAHHVLPHIHHGVPCGSPQYLHRLNFLDLLHRRTRRRHQNSWRRHPCRLLASFCSAGFHASVLRFTHHGDAWPPVVVISRRAPSSLLQSCVVRLAIINIRQQHRSRRRLPTPIARYNFLRSIRVRNH